MRGLERVGGLKSDSDRGDWIEGATIGEELLEIAAVRRRDDRVVGPRLRFPAGLQDWKHVRVAEVLPLFRFAFESLGGRVAPGLRIKDLGDDRHPVRTAGPKGRAPLRIFDQDLEPVAVGQCVADERLGARLSLGAVHGGSIGAYR